MEFTVQAHAEDRNDVMPFRLEARNRAGDVVDRVLRGEMIDVYVYVTSGLDETAIRSASAIPDLRTLGMKAHAGFNLFDDPHKELMLAQFSRQVVGSGMVELAFDAKDGSGNLYDLWPATSIPYAAIEFVDLSLRVVTGWHNAEMPADVDGDRSVVPRDVLILINELNRAGSRLLPEPVEAEGEADPEPRYYDVNNGGFFTPLDAMRVINVLNDPVSQAEGEPEELWRPA